MSFLSRRDGFEALRLHFYGEVMHTLAILLVLFACTSCRLVGQEPTPPAPATSKRLLDRLDANGDGKLDDGEKRAARTKLREMQDRPGARTPSATTERVGKRDVTEMEYPSSDGRKIPCVLSMPIGDGPFPIVVTIHGGQGNRDVAFLRTMAAPDSPSPTVVALNEQTWAILAVSFRAGNGALFGMEQDDVVAGIRFAKTLPKVDPDRIGVVGGSHGGHLALAAAQRMGRDLLCVIAGSPWMTDPIVYMTGDPATPPLSLVPDEARAELVRNGRMFFQGFLRGRGMSEPQAMQFLAQHSIEANAEKIEVPTLFVTSRGDDQAPHVLIEPMIRRMQDAGKDIEVHTAEMSPHGFYWARSVSLARDLRGEKSGEEQQEEVAARSAILEFLARNFSRTQVPAPQVRTSAPAAAGLPVEPSTGKASAAVEASASVRPEKPVADEKAHEPVRIASGLLAGETREGVRIFRGIPYAAPPVGDLRWQAPQPPKPWSGVRDATRFGAPALQNPVYFSREVQSEDCLFVNVWAPEKAAIPGKLPVLVWFHGGAFQQNSGAQPRYDGSELARRGVVVVTMNYRLGPLGLFAHPLLTGGAEPGAPLGNYCLLDMIAALQWTRDNIAAFGGDPDNVTISGSSAGGTSCLFLMGIPSAHGLFHKVVIHSSGGIRNIQDLRTAEAAGLRLTEHLGFGEDVSIAQLRGVAADRIAGDIALVRQLDLPVKPIVDGRLVTQVPEATFAQGKQARVPVLMGAANGESGARAFGDDIATGGAFGFQRRLADDMARSGQQVYLFQLTFVPPEARANRFAAQHGESVAYAFGTIGRPVEAQHGFRNPAQAERAMRGRRGGSATPARGGMEDDGAPVDDSQQARALSDAMLRHLVAFVRTGAPDAEGLAPWPAYAPDDPQTMVFGNHGIAAKKASR